MALAPWLLGRHVTSVLIHVQTYDSATGALAPAAVTASTQSQLVVTTGVLDEIRLTSTRETENISPANSQKSHAVPIKSGFNLQVSEVMRSSVAGCLLANIWFAGPTNYVSFTFTRAGRSWLGYFLMASYNETIVRGKNVARMTLVSVDNGAATYV